MNIQAERHLAKAEGYLAKGEAWYRKAAAEIVAAKEADFSLSNKTVGEKFGKTSTWVSDLVRWSTSESGRATPFGGDEHNARSDRAKAKRILREAPLELIEQIIAGLPKERQQAIGAAAREEYLKARQDYDEIEKHLTPAEQQEREATAETLTQSVREAAGGFLSLGIAAHLEQATEELHELVADASLTAETLRIVLAADKDWVNELQVAVAMAGLEYDRIEV